MSVSPKMSRSARSRTGRFFVRTSDPTLCPECGRESRVRDSRVATNGWRRRRICPKGHLWSTLEVVVVEHRGGNAALTLPTDTPCKGCQTKATKLRLIARMAGEA